MSQAPPTRRRWFQFGLRELFWLTLVVALSILGARERRARIGLENEVKTERHARKQQAALIEVLTHRLVKAESDAVNAHARRLIAEATRAGEYITSTTQQVIGSWPTNRESVPSDEIRTGGQSNPRSAPSKDR
jgi:hypothetical protein